MSVDASVQEGDFACALKGPLTNILFDVLHTDRWETKEASREDIVLAIQEFPSSWRLDVPGEEYFYGLFGYEPADADLDHNWAIVLYAHYIDFLARCLALFADHDVIHISFS